MHKVSAAYENDIGVHTRTVHLSENCISVDQMCFYSGINPKIIYRFCELLSRLQLPRQKLIILNVLFCCGIQCFVSADL